MKILAIIASIGVIYILATSYKSLNKYGLNITKNNYDFQIHAKLSDSRYRRMQIWGNCNRLGNITLCKYNMNLQRVYDKIPSKGIRL